MALAAERAGGKDAGLARLAQLVEQWTENPRVPGSSPGPGNLVFAPLRGLRDPNQFLAAASALFAATWAVGGHRLRLLEVEFYLFGPGHPDPYVHAQPGQSSYGRWCLHRTGNSFRGGSFKGLDLSFGPKNVFGGVLLRSLTDGDQVVRGPCLVVERLLSLLGVAHLAELEPALEATTWEPGPPAPDGSSEAPGVLASARVGLGLARAARFPAMPRYVARRYRFVADPSFGGPHLAVAMHQDGIHQGDIASLLAVRPSTLARWLRAHDEGRSNPHVLPVDPHRPEDVCRRLGALARPA